MLWIKAFHIIFMVTWFAGLLYLPRLFVYHAMASDPPGRERFALMERKLFIMMSIGATLTLIFGIALLSRFSISPGYLQQGWLHLKLALVVLLVIYHMFCLQLMKRLRDGTNQRSQQWFRWFNEIPALILIAIVLLVVVKPF